LALQTTPVRVRWSSGHGRSFSGLPLLLLGIKGSTRGFEVIESVAIEAEDYTFEHHTTRINAAWTRCDSGRFDTRFVRE